MNIADKFLEKVYEYERVRDELRMQAILYIHKALDEYRNGQYQKIDLTDNQINIYYQGDYVQAYEVYLTPNNNLMVDVENFGSIRIEHLFTDDLKNIALEVHEIMITD